MDQQTLHNKVIQCSKRNKKLLSNILQQIDTRKKDARNMQISRLNDFRKEYEELVKLNQQSEQQTFRLKKELARLDNQIEQLSLKNTFSRSRIKLQSEQIQSVKDQTYKTDRKRKNQGKIFKTNEELKDEIERLQRQIHRKQSSMQIKKQNYANYQKESDQLDLKRQQMQKLHKQTEHKYQQKITQLQCELKSLKNESAQLQFLKDKQSEKTKRNTKVEVLNQIRGLLRKHKQTYSNFDNCL